MKCLQCGKEIPEGRKFCNSSCAAKYNNRNRTRKPWTEEQRKKLSTSKRISNDARRLKRGRERYYTSEGEFVGRTCKYCGKPSGTHKVCDECSQYQKPVVYKRLKLVEGSLKSRFEKAKKLIQTWYFQDKQSISQIAEHTGLQFGTIRYFLTFDKKTRSRGEGTRNAIEQGRRQDCHKNPSFKSGIHVSWDRKKYHFRSSWEEEYMKQLDEQKISYLYEPFTIRYFDTQRNEERVALPDFFFPETNTILELKSSFTYDEQNMRDRFKAYKEKGYKTKLLLNWKEVQL